MNLLLKKLFLIILASAMLLTSLCACQGPEPQEPQTPQFRDLTWAVGAPLPRAEDFAVLLPQGASVRYAEEYSFTAIGDYRLSLIVTDSNGAEQAYDVGFSLVYDTQEPVIEGAKDLVAYLGDGISYRTGVTVSDNCDGRVTLTVDSASVDTSRAGAYPVTYTATDAAGNVTVLTVTVYVYEEKVTTEMLYALLDPIIAAKISPHTTKEQQAREVYSYVYYNIAYISTSDKTDWVRAAYDGLRTGQGDCYTYFAISKAFFERLGIASMDVHRTEGIVQERHYWNYVNIGDESNPRWYHFDACRLRGVQHSGCLLTSTQVNAYTRIREDENGVKGYFYAYDASAFPQSATQIITETPSLEPYY